MTNHPPRRPPEVVLADRGGWISGPSADVEPVDAAMIRPGADRIIFEDGMIADMSVVRPGTFWFNTGESGPGVAITWHERGGTASGVIHRPNAATIWILSR